MGRLTRLIPWILVAAAVAAALAPEPGVHREIRRAALDIAADDGLPGTVLQQRPETVRNFAERLGDQRDAYAQVAVADTKVSALTFALYLLVAFIAWPRVPRRWPAMLIAFAAAYFACAWWQNAALASALRAGAAEAAAYAPVVLAADLKWLFGALSVLSAAVVGVIFLGPWRPWFLATFHDVPYFLDRATRRMEFRLNTEFARPDGSLAEPAPRAAWRVPAFWLYGATVVFVCYGPTLDGLCSASAGMVTAALMVLGGGLVAWLTLGVPRRALEWARERLRDYGYPGEPGDEAYRESRYSATVMMLAVCVLLVLVPAALAAASALYTALGGACGGVAFSGRSLARFVLCAVAIAAFALVWTREKRTGALIAWQAAILALTALVVWFALARSDAASEASGEPYRHVFALVAPAFAATLLLAPWLARTLVGRPLAGTSGHWRTRLASRELFHVLGETPPPTRGAVWHALLFGITYRLMQLALLPALVALVAPKDWLLALTLAALLVSIGLSTWGNLSARWRQMPTLLERWWLSGIAFFVSLFVIAVAAARLMEVSYVTTLLEGAPFGAIFSSVLMCYVLAWLVEYWANRAPAYELMRVLGHAGPSTLMPYPFRGPVHRGADEEGRYIAAHSLGRFLVLGKAAGRQAPAFHTYSLTELFSELCSGDEAPKSAAVSRQVHLYFYAMNGLLAALVLAFAGAWMVLNAAPAPEPVVTARADAPLAHTVDLADRLLAPPGDERPALVVAASGGGTRAAVFAAHVLEGLHRLGADRDIVLTSGVSGGGVALAYFALHYPQLAAPDPGAEPHWQRFRALIEDNYIDDVLEGATEWRIFGNAPLSRLLAESFERRLFAPTDELARAKRAATLALPDTPALILNTTIAGHPDFDSALLRVTLNRPRPRDACAEHERPYKLLAGGRLVFTNIRHTASFPGADSPIPDVRLPYAIVRDPEVRLAQAAALNANFPPVFPNARVALTNGALGASCPDRSYFVTDGGAEENLGLVSALYAVHSALTEINRRCRDGGARRDAWCRRTLRPLRFVLAEASATGYDYEQDRGLSAGLEGGKDRLTGGLTNELIARTQYLYRSSPASPSRAREMEFHYLAMPLVFRSRGGIGTHWTHANRFTLADPRVRDPYPNWVLAPLRLAGLRQTVELDWASITRMWSALHQPGREFCDDASYGGVDTDTVRRWICGGRYDADRPRDLHILEWQKLVRALRPGPAIP